MGQLIEVRSLNYRITVNPHVIPSLSVSHDEEDIWTIQILQLPVDGLSPTGKTWQQGIK